LHEFWACHWGVEVEIFQIDCAVARTFCGNNAVEMNFDHDHVHSGGTAIPGISDVIAANGKASAIGIGLLRAIVDAHASVCDVFALVDRDIVSSDEGDHVGAVANAGDALGKATKFDCVGLAPEFFVFGVDKKMVHFHESAGVGVEDSIENFLRELPTRCLFCHEWAASDVVVNMDAC
jgi:hypothetical protein